MANPHDTPCPCLEGQNVPSQQSLEISTLPSKQGKAVSRCFSTQVKAEMASKVNLQGALQENFPYPRVLLAENLSKIIGRAHVHSNGRFFFLCFMSSLLLLSWRVSPSIQETKGGISIDMIKIFGRRQTVIKQTHLLLIEQNTSTVYFLPALRSTRQSDLCSSKCNQNVSPNRYVT